MNSQSSPGQSISDGAVVFLFNHDAAHQLAHTAGILSELALASPTFEIVCAFGNEAIRRGVLDAVADAAVERINWYDLSLPGLFKPLVHAANRLVPAERLLRLEYHAAQLSKAALIVSPERTCLHLKRKWGATSPAFVFIPHGAGDRSVTYHPSMAGFDWMLVSGQKVADEMIMHGLSRPENLRIIGYPKFDLIDVDARPRFFDNDRTTFIYNPHFDPHLSSWYEIGPMLLDWFATGAGQRFNLIFAPHVMLFHKKIHISPEYRVMRIRPDIDPAWRSAANIHIDIDSPRLFDMSYTLGADAYIGDVSSQVYEFLVHPRPCIFIDTSKGQQPYMFWEAGDVVHNATELVQIIPTVPNDWVKYRESQKRIFDYTISRDVRSSSSRGASALIDIMQTEALRGGPKQTA